MSTIPAIVAKYLPLKTYDTAQTKMFNICLKLLQSGRFKEESTLQMLVTSMIGFAQSEKERYLLLKWFNNQGEISSQEGDVI